MEIHINLWAVLLAGISSMVIGTIYYADGLLGKQWKILGKIDTKKFEKEMPKLMPLLFLAALITSYAVAYFTFIYQNFFRDSWIASGINVALILWLGVSATTLVVHSSMDQKPAKFIYISLGNRLLSLLAMGLIIGWLHP